MFSYNKNALMLLLGLVLVSLLQASLANAQTSGFFSSSPGDLSKEHASLDNSSKCNDCHVSNSKAVDSDKCLNCHDHGDLKKRIRAGKGYHASVQVKGKSCANCHLEHKGRGFAVMSFRTIGGVKNFDHKLGGWVLVGKHKVLACSNCHKKKNKAGRRTYLGLVKNCGSCHKDDQPHDFDRKALLQCERCHTEVSWTPPKTRMRFDHNKKSDAEFPQEGSHRDVSCGKCHPRARFNLKRSKPGNCGNSGCHRSPHKGMLFDKKSCDWCHSAKSRSLRIYSFNHRARTRFKMTGRHSKLKCEKCHTKKLGSKKPKMACAQCHRNDNPHKNRFKAFGRPPKCQVCHAESSWSPNRFKAKHGRSTRFPLWGMHATKCRNCHTGSKPYNFLNVSKSTNGGQLCMSCHEHKNAHSGEFTDQPKGKKVMRNGERVQTCLSCHRKPGTKKILKSAGKHVHGPGKRWPTLHGHAKVGCEVCHKDDSYSDTPKQCGVRCHDDSLHVGRLGDECDRCHQPGVWNAVNFDHTDDTEWPLLGLHNRVPECAQCHPKQKFKGTPQNCSAKGCHAKDDVHRSRLGDKCEACHLESGENIFDHNIQSDFKLTGKHLTVRCTDCHPSDTYKPRPKDCFGGGVCHEEPKVHKGEFGTNCASCHTTTSFTDILALHDVGEFQLKGAHNQQPCSACHTNSSRQGNKRLGGTGNLCITCHRQDDPHVNSLSARCGTCHNQWSFVPAEFNHDKVGCNMNGQHRTLPCFDCHNAGNYGGSSPLCVSCHKKDADNYDQAHKAYTSCADCHNPTTWVPAIGGIRESICR